MRQRAEGGHPSRATVSNQCFNCAAFDHTNAGTLVTVLLLLGSQRKSNQEYTRIHAPLQQKSPSNLATRCIQSIMKLDATCLSCGSSVFNPIAPFSVASSPHSFLSLYNSLDKLQRAPTSKNQVRFQPLSNRGSFLCTLKNHLQVALQTQNSDRPGKHQYPAFTQLNQLTPDKPDKPDTLTVQTCSNMAP